jgi:hypothetical protein
MPRAGVFRSCTCILCVEKNGPNGCEIPDHEWKSHLRLKARLQKDNLERQRQTDSLTDTSTDEISQLIFGLTINDEARESRGAFNTDPLWQSGIEDIEPDVLMGGKPTPPTPEEISLALMRITNALGEKPYLPKSSDPTSRLEQLRSVIHEKKTALQRKFTRTFSHISTQRHLKRLTQVQLSFEKIQSLLENRVESRPDDLNAIKTSLSIVRKELESIPKHNISIKEQCVKKLKTLSLLESHYEEEQAKWPVDVDDPIVFDTSKYR